MALVANWPRLSCESWNGLPNQFILGKSQYFTKLNSGHLGMIPQILTIIYGVSVVPWGRDQFYPDLIVLFHAKQLRATKKYWKFSGTFSINEMNYMYYVYIYIYIYIYIDIYIYMYPVYVTENALTSSLKPWALAQSTKLILDLGSSNRAVDKRIQDGRTNMFRMCLGSLQCLHLASRLAS